MTGQMSGIIFLSLGYVEEIFHGVVTTVMLQSVTKLSLKNTITKFNLFQYFKI